MTPTQPSSGSPLFPWGSQASGEGRAPLFHGFLEPTWGCIEVVEKLGEAIRANKGVLPQKYLYASLHGARLWKELCEGGSHIAEVYRRFPLSNSRAPFTAKFRQQVEKMMTGRTERALGLIALGAGTGKREAQICKWLADELDLQHVSALVLDVSSELLGVSLREFNNCGQRIHPQFAVMDFESEAGLQHLKWLRKTWENHPVMFLLLGNTFGNIDEALFLTRMAEVMRADDLMLCESLLTTDTETRTAYNPTRDPRADFIVDPLRGLGINPQLKNLQCLVTSESGKWVRQEFRYRFSDDEAGLQLTVSPRPTIMKNSWVGLLEIQALTADRCKDVFSDVFSKVELIDHEYDIDDRKLNMAYCFASAPRRSAAVVVLDERATMENPNTIKLHEELLEIECDGMKCELYATHFAFIAVLSQEPQGSKKRGGLDIQEAVIKWLDNFVAGGGILPSKAQNKLKTLKESQENSATDGISNLKDDVEKSLNGTHRENVVAQRLREIWPGDKEWSFRTR